jgi:hypothetical protein
MHWVTKPIVGLKHMTFHLIDAHMWFRNIVSQQGDLAWFLKWIGWKLWKIRSYNVTMLFIELFKNLNEGSLPKTWWMQQMFWTIHFGFNVMLNMFSWFNETFEHFIYYCHERNIQPSIYGSSSYHYWMRFCSSNNHHNSLS